MTATQMNLSEVSLETTLGAYRSWKGHGSAPSLPAVYYWRPCITYLPTHIRDERGRPISHAWFIASSEDGHLACPRCRLLPKDQRRIEWDRDDVYTKDLPF